MDLNELLVFAKVVQGQSFIAAARELGMPKSTVSRKVADLEERLGARLLSRTTRQLSLTDAGRAFYRHAARVVAEAEEATAAVGRMQDLPRGLLRVTAPLNFGFLGPMVSDFLSRYPEVSLELVCTDRVVDLVQEGFDVAIRAGKLSDSTLIARNLGAMSSYVVASPSFVKKHGEPQIPSALQSLDCVVFGAPTERISWRLRSGGKSSVVQIRPRLTVNDFDFLEDAVLRGHGVSILPAFRAADLLRRRRLCHLLPEWRADEIPLSALYASQRLLSPKVKAFIEHLTERMSPPPWEMKALG